MNHVRNKLFSVSVIYRFLSEKTRVEINNTADNSSKIKEEDKTVIFDVKIIAHVPFQLNLFYF